MSDIKVTSHNKTVYIFIPPQNVFTFQNVVCKVTKRHFQMLLTIQQALWMNFSITRNKFHNYKKTNVLCPPAGSGARAEGAGRARGRRASSERVGPRPAAVLRLCHQWGHEDPTGQPRPDSTHGHDWQQVGPHCNTHSLLWVICYICRPAYTHTSIVDKYYMLESK